MVSSTQRKIAGGIQPPNAPLTVAVKQNSKTLRDRGQLMTSINARPSANDVSIGTNRMGARINHFGGTIRAKKNWLFIPAGADTRKMQRKFGTKPGDCIRGMRRAGFSIWFQTNPKSGVVMARAKQGRDKKPWVLFVLKKQVKIPARPFLTVDKRDRQVIQLMVKRHIGITT